MIGKLRTILDSDTTTLNGASSSTSKPTTTKKSVNTLAKEVLVGKWGNGQERIDRLKAAGYNVDIVQASVNAPLDKEETQHTPRGRKVIYM